MAVYLSPGVYPNEIDLSAFIGVQSDVVPGFVGTANKGPINTPVFISTAEQFIDTFGEPFPDSYLGYAVLNYLLEGNQCWVVRVGIECDDGQDSALDDVCIDTSGARGKGWGRIPLFSGVDFGQLCTRVIDADNPLVIHAASTTAPTFTDVDESASDGPTTASLALSGTYNEAIDDTFFVNITGAPTGTLIDGADYEIVRNSDAEVIATGTFSAVAGVTSSFAIGTGSDATGLTGIITVTGSSAVETGDYFSFVAAPDNTTAQFSVEGVAQVAAVLSPTTYTSATTFADDLNSAAGSSEDWIAIVQDDETVCIRTDTEGRWIQLISTEAFALEVGLSLWAYDIPRSHAVGTSLSPYNINSNKNRVKINVVGTTASDVIEVSVPVSATHSAASLKTVFNGANEVDGIPKFDAVALRLSDSQVVLALMTTIDNAEDDLSLLANNSNLKTLRFAQELGMNFPFGTGYRVFDDARVLLPEGGTVDPAVPLSCDIDPLSSQCSLDSSYYQKIVGFVVAKSPGTWIDDFKLTIQIYNNTSGKYTLRIVEVSSNVEVHRIDDVSFDSREARYIGNIVNEGSSIGGAAGDSYIRWEERPSYLNNDATDLLTFEVRTPGTFSTQTFDGGADGIPVDATFSTELDAAIIGSPQDNSGIWALQNPDLFNINMLLTPGVSTGSVLSQAITMCEGRGDCIYIVDPPFGLTPQQVVDWHNGMLDSSLLTAINTSYAALYWSWQKIYDQFSAEEIFVPPSGQVAAVFARTARVAEQWFAPAGLNRGKLTTSLDIEFNPSQGERNLMYSQGNAVNFIVKFPQDGIAVFGQRTLQRAATALDRVNVRMLLIFLKKELIKTLRTFLFEPNDRFTRGEVVNRIEPFLAEIAARRGVTGFKVICDQTNNTPQRIDRNELWVSVLVRPTRAAEFVVLNIGVLRSDQSFSAEEVLAQTGVVLT